jgi:hypothetical protein
MSPGIIPRTPATREPGGGDALPRGCSLLLAQGSALTQSAQQ